MAAFTGFNLPDISNNKLKDEKERKQIMDYLFQLTEQLKYVMTHLDADNMTDAFREEIRNGVDTSAFERMIADTDGRMSSLSKQTAAGFEQVAQKTEELTLAAEQSAKNDEEIRKALENVGGDAGKNAAAIESIRTDLQTYQTQTAEGFEQVAQKTTEIESAVTQLGVDTSSALNAAAEERQELRVDMESYQRQTAEGFEQAASRSETIEKSVVVLQSGVTEAKSSAETAVSTAQSANESAEAAKAAADTAGENATEAKNAADAAGEAANDAKTAAESAGAVANEAKGVANNASVAADEAKEQVTVVRTELESYQTQTAEEIRSVVSRTETVETATEEAKQAADTANETASAAATIAEAAKAAADTAGENATEAKNAADAAGEAANDAKTAAESASAVADEAKGVATNTQTTLESYQSQTAAGFEQVVKKNEVVSAINQSAEEVGINAKRVNLEGYVSINGTFSVDEQGYVRCTGGTLGAFTVDINGAIMGNGRMMIGSMTLDGKTISGMTSAPNLKIEPKNIQEGKWAELGQGSQVLGVDGNYGFAFGVPYVTINGTDYYVNFTTGSYSPPTSTFVDAVRLTGDRVYKRTGPGTDYPEIGYCYSGEMYRGTVSGGWAYCTAQLTYSSAAGGYVSVPLEQNFYCAAQYVEQTTVQLA